MPFDPFGYNAKIATIQQALTTIKASVDKPGWLVPTPPVSGHALATATASPIVIPPEPPPNTGVIVDTQGIVYALLYAIIGLLEQVEAAQALQATLANQQTILTNQGVIMSALTDLQAAVANLTSAQMADATAIQAAITALGNAAASGSVDPADVETAVTAINNVVSQMMASDTALNNAVTPPATPPSSP